MWSDNETNADFIDYNHLIIAVTGIIDNPNLLPCSIGVFDDWGSGKSSLMKMVEEKYKDQENTLVIRFNGWLFEGYEDTKTVLMGRILYQKQQTTCWQRFLALLQQSLLLQPLSKCSSTCINTIKHPLFAYT
jgi:hypothetical protein